MNTKRHLVIIMVLVSSLFMTILTLAQESISEPEQTPLALTSITPQRVLSGQAATVTLTGDGFTGNTIVQLNGVVQVDYSFVNASTIALTLPAAPAAGAYTVTVVNPDGSSASLSSALIIEDPPTPTVPPITIVRTEPQQVTAGQQIALSVFGNNFTAASVVRLVGVGLLPTNYVHSGALTAVVPETLLPGRYTIEVSDPNGSSAISPGTLTVAALPPTPAPPPATPTPVQIVSRPALIVTGFTVEPATIAPGQSARLMFIVSNHGNQTAQAVNINLGSGSTFVPAGGQSSLTLPDIHPGGSHNGQMTVAAALDIPTGPVTIPLVLTYRDQTGERYTSNAELSVTLRSIMENSQIVIDAYAVDPAAAEPGSPVSVRMTVVNEGNTTASQVVVRFTGGEGVLLPNGRGDSFVMGDLPPGQRAPLQVPLILSATAKNGPQMQPVVITYVQNGEAKETNTTITVNVAATNQPQPLLLLSQYTTGHDVLQPGTRFTLEIALQNAGSGDAGTTMVTFGTVESSGDNGDSGNPDRNGGGSQTDTTPSTTFAPLGTAGLVYVGDIARGGTAEISQEFLVTGSVTSGIYNLPVTLQYTTPDGTARQNALSISLVVIVPPRLQINLINPLPEMVNTGEPAALMLELVNDGRTSLNLLNATVSAHNAEVWEGADIRLSSLKVDDDTSLNALIMPLEEGPVEVTVTINYLNDLGQLSSIEQTYTAEAVTPPPPVDEPVDTPPVIAEPEPEINWFGRALMALLGLGS